MDIIAEFITRQVYQITTLILALITIGVWVDNIRRHPRAWRFAVAPLTWLIHTAIFYTAVLFLREHLIGIVVFGDWSAGLRLHGIITVALLSLSMRRFPLWTLI